MDQKFVMCSRSVPEWNVNCTIEGVAAVVATTVICYSATWDHNSMFLDTPGVQLLASATPESDKKVTMSQQSSYSSLHSLPSAPLLDDGSQEELAVPSRRAHPTDSEGMHAIQVLLGLVLLQRLCCVHRMARPSSYLASRQQNPQR